MPGIDSKKLQNLWKRCQGLPGGKWLFSKAIGFAVPYTGTAGMIVDKLSPGDVEILLKDHRRVRNHLKSIHAVALANIGEFTGGLAVLSAAPEGARTIITSLKIEYLKKARGLLRAKARVPIMQSLNQDTVVPVTTEVTDADGNIVARAHAEWRVRGDRGKT